MKEKLVKLAQHLDSIGLTAEADTVDSVLSRLSESKREKIHDKYYNDNSHHYKGKKGERFKNCVKEKIELHNNGIQPLKLNKNKTVEEAAAALCSWQNKH